jgi:uncharacterized protein (DUF2267 family)
LDYAQFLGEVRENGCFVSSEEAETTVVSVLMAMSEVLPGPQLEALSSRLPPEAMVYLRRTGSEPDPLFDSHLFVGWVVSSLDSTGIRDKTSGGLDLTAAYSGEEAIRRVGCVFSVLKRQLEPSQQQELAAVLPEEVDAWFLNA